MANDEPEEIERKTIFECPGQRIEAVKLRYRGGLVRERAFVRSPAGAVIFAIDDRERVCLIEGFRPAAGRKVIELPAGKIEAGDTPLEGARRELAEEAGLEAASWSALGTALGGQGNSDWQCHYFLAENLSACPERREPGEDHRVFWLDVQELWQWVDEGRIDNNYSLVGIYKAMARLGYLSGQFKPST